MSRYSHKDRRSSRYDSDDSDSDCEAHTDHKISRFVGDTAEKVVQPFEIATKMVMNPIFGLLSPPKRKQGKKTRKGGHEEAYGKKHHDNRNPRVTNLSCGNNKSG